MDAWLLLAYAGIGLLTGFMSGLFGIGGGSIRVPLLVLSGMPILAAFAVNMFAIPFSSAEGAYVQRKNINYVIAKPFIIGAVLAMIIATVLTGIVSSKFLAITFFLAAILTVAALYVDKIDKSLYARFVPTKKNLFFGAFLTNLLIGLRGGSGGSLFAPLLKAFHLEMHHAIATALFAGFFSSLIATTIYFFRGDLLFAPALLVAGLGIIGSYLGSTLSIHTQSKTLKAGLAIVVVLLALSVVYKEFF